MNEVVAILEDGRRIIFQVHPAPMGHVKVSIEAPRTVKILRGEIDCTGRRSASRLGTAVRSIVNATDNPIPRPGSRAGTSTFEERLAMARERFVRNNPFCRTSLWAESGE